MRNLNDRLKQANMELGKSVVQVNPNIIDVVKEKNERILYFGVKNTDQIPSIMVEKICSNPTYAWLTIDKASHNGRAIDTDLINPVTYRAMTGSSSGGPINILKGVIDFAIGTDGGGSVLGPAMSCQLPSVIGAGVDLFVNKKKTSTDGSQFSGSVGFIAKKVSILKDVMECVLDDELHADSRRNVKIVIPKRGSIHCPDDMDMYDKIMNYLAGVECSNYTFEEVNMTGIDDRKIGISTIKKCLGNAGADLILTMEGPVDVYGYGETIPQCFGKPGVELTKNHGKYLLRAANMCRTTAITVPTSMLASGILIIAKAGVKHAGYAFDLAKKLEESIKLPEVWKRCFLDEQQHSGITFNSYTQ